MPGPEEKLASMVEDVQDPRGALKAMKIMEEAVRSFYGDKNIRY
jgi:hypothetical protein